MKRTCKFIVFVALFLLTCGARLYSADLTALRRDYIIYAQYGTEKTQKVFNGYERIDFAGGEAAALDFAAKLSARVIKKENASGAWIFYCYSPIIFKQVRLFGERVNLMIAVRGDRVAAGSPLIKGSF